MLVLFIIIVLTLGFPFAYRLFDEPETYDLESYQKEIAEFRASAVRTKGSYRSVKKKMEESEQQPTYFTFDPNTLPQPGWQRLGLSSRQAGVIRNYISKGGKFYRDEDLRKIYSITEKQYNNLKPYIRIAPDGGEDRAYRQPEPGQTSYSKKPEVLVVELNSADSTELERLRGIGPAFASRIIRYRTRLGGFHHEEQLREVYGMDSLRYSQLAGQVSVNQALLVKLNVNTATFGQLKAHPYLTYKQINAIIQYRRQHGYYSSPADLRKVLILDEEIIRKIEPYLAFDL